jgi:hypothetical protein
MGSFGRFDLPPLNASGVLVIGRDGCFRVNVKSGRGASSNFSLWQSSRQMNVHIQERPDPPGK